MTDPENLSLDEWDALLIEEWFQADPGAPAPVSSREGEIEWADQNDAAWALVEPKLSMSIEDAKKLIRLAPHPGA